MIVYKLGDVLSECKDFILDKCKSSENSQSYGKYLIISDKKDWLIDSSKIGMDIEEDMLVPSGHFTKVETMDECLLGQLSVPRILDIQGKRHEISFLITENVFFIVDEDDYANQCINKISAKKVQNVASNEEFLYSFINEILRRDVDILDEYERRIIGLEEEVQNDNLEGFHELMMPIRKDLLVLKGYYEQLSDMGKELEENENGFFEKKGIKYFSTLSDKGERLQGKCMELIDYSQQVRDVFQTKVDERHNDNIEFLTIVSSIFLPLTLVTSWYGMNFENMPEIENGYPYVIAACLIIITCMILWFKKKRFF